MVIDKPVLTLPGPKKAAVILLTLGEEASAAVLRELDEDNVQRLSREIARLGPVSSAQAEAVLEELNQMGIAHEFVIRGGIDHARKLLVGAYGPETGQKLLDRLIQTLGAEPVNFDALQKADPQQLAKFIHNEHPQTIALVLSHLHPAQAAALLVSLPLEMRHDIALRMANLEQISPEVIGKIAAIIDQKLKSLGEFSRESHGGVRAVAEMFNRLDFTASMDILEKIEPTDPGLVETIRHLMFVFEDLMLVDQNGMKELVSRVDRKRLTMALKGTSEKLKDHFLHCMSQRGSEMMREDMEALGAVKIRDVEAAQQQIIAVLRQLEAEGLVTLRGTAGDGYIN